MEALLGIFFIIFSDLILVSFWDLQNNNDHT